MDISRTTVTELYESARYKIADSIVNGKALEISGGNYRFCDGTADFCCNTDCGRAEETGCESIIRMKGEFTMRIAVTYENGQIFQHFGHTEQFKLYDVEDGKVTGSQVVDTNGDVYKRQSLYNGLGRYIGAQTHVGQHIDALNIICLLYTSRCV